MLSYQTPANIEEIDLESLVIRVIRTLTKKVISLFLKKYRSNRRPTLREEKLKLTEQHLRLKFPRDYRYIVTTYGPFSTPQLASTVIQENSNLPTVIEFITPDRIDYFTRRFTAAGMSRDYFVFAMTSNDQPLCFLKKTRSSKVFRYNPQTRHIAQIASSLTALLAKYNDLKK